MEVLAYDRNLWKFPIFSYQVNSTVESFAAFWLSSKEDKEYTGAVFKLPL